MEAAMLPDFPKLKFDLLGCLKLFLESRMLEHLGPLSESRRVRYFEGQKRQMIRRSGERETVEPFDLSSTLTFKDDELPTLTLDNLLQRLDSAAKGMAGQMATHVHESISEVADRVGNAIDANRKKVSAEMILEMFSKIDIEFDDNGRPLMPSLHCHPNQGKAVRMAMEQLDDSPDLRKQWQELMITKKEEWRVREASRKLVG
jgi:hypothetical protein